MRISTLVSGSDGNVTALYVGEEIVLVDCGKTVAWTLERLGYRLPRAILFTHEHSDHARGAREFLRRGVRIYMTAVTKHALNLPTTYNVHIIAAVTNEHSDAENFFVKFAHLNASYFEE